MTYHRITGKHLHTTDQCFNFINNLEDTALYMFISFCDLLMDILTNEIYCPLTFDGVQGKIRLSTTVVTLQVRFI